MTIVRNGEDYLEACILQVVDKVSTVKITVDSRSTDKTWEIAQRLATYYQNIKLDKRTILEPLVDMVAARNTQLDFTETWGFILDSDEFHYKIGEYEFTSEKESDLEAYAFQTYTPWTSYGKGHKASDRAVIGRIFKNRGVLQWRGTFGKEKLYRGDKEVFKEDRSKKEFNERYKDMIVLPHRYIHFTHLKSDDWRTEMKQGRIADSRDLYQLPDNVIRIIDNIHGEMEMPTVRGWHQLRRSEHGE